MRNVLLLLVGVIALYLVTSLVLYGIYGESYGLFPGTDCWKPDSQGGWMKYGNPTDPPPPGPSRNIPVLVNYLPIFLPGLLLFLFLFTPLSRKLDSPRQPEPDEPEGNDGSNTDGDLRQT